MQSSITSRVILGEEGAENAKKLISVKTSCRRQFFKKIEITNCGLYLVFAPYTHTLKSHVLHRTSILISQHHFV